MGTSQINYKVVTLLSKQQVRIGILGQSRSGKSTLAKAVEELYSDGGFGLEHSEKEMKVQVVKISDGIKELASKIVGESITEENKPRELMEKLGKKDSKHWLKKAIDKIESSDADVIVVDDVRRLSEVKALSDIGFHIICAVCEEDVLIQRRKDRGEDTSKVNPSDIEADTAMKLIGAGDSILYHFGIKNNGKDCTLRVGDVPQEYNMLDGYFLVVDDEVAMINTSRNRDIFIYSIYILSIIETLKQIKQMKEGK